MEIEFEFEELCPRNLDGKLITGMMLYGVATLADDGAGNWHVAEVQLTGGGRVTWREYHANPKSLDGVVFHTVMRELHNRHTELGKLADDAWAEAVSTAKEDAAAARADYLNDRERGA